MGVPFFITPTNHIKSVIAVMNGTFTVLITQKGKSSFPPKGNYRKKSNKSTIFADLVKLKV